MTELESRIQALECRVQEMDDRLAIYQLLCTYSIAVDSLAAEAVRDIYTEDGTYDQHAKGGRPAPAYVGAEALLRVVHSDTQKVNTKLGCAHVMPMPYIEIDGDTAVATGVSQMYVKRGSIWLADRTSANSWNLVRTPGGWKVRYRRNRMLDGTPEHREILGTPFRKSSQPQGSAQEGKADE